MTLSSQSPSGQTWNAAGYAANAQFVPALGQPVFELLQARPGERILDLGCGDGALTEKLVALGAQVVGIDSSPDMIAAARQRGLDARMMDARSLVFEDELTRSFPMPRCTGSKTIRTRRSRVPLCPESRRAVCGGRPPKAGPRRDPLWRA